MLILCLYSKYSQRCKEFLDELDGEIQPRMICIDHKDVRKMVMQDENGYHVKTVPCLFLFFPNGRLEKYEGSDAFVWVRKWKEKNNESLPPSQSTIMASPSIITPLPPPPPPQQSPPIPSPPIPEKTTDDKEKTDSVEQIMEKETQMRMATDQIITRKQDNIKELAQMMQRQRESEEERMNPPPPGSRS
jgi:hypothetical protein